MNLPSFKKCEEFIGVMLVIFSGFAVTAFYKINNYMTFPNLDELFWHARSRLFWDKILSFDFSGLIQSAQPGITVYWFTGFTMKFIDFDFSYVYYLIAEKEASGGDFNTVMNTNDQAIYEIFQGVSFLFNLPMIFITAVFCIVFYYLLKKIGYNIVITSFALYFLVTNIFFVYWTTPSDKMLNIFMTLSLLTFIVYMKDRSSRKYLILSAILGSWAVLSKISALFIIPFFFLAYCFYIWPLDRKKISGLLKDSLLWIACFVVVSVVFLPTIITHPIEIYNLVIKTDGRVYETTYAAVSFVERVPDYIGPMFTVFGSSMSPGIVIFLTMFALMSLRKEYKPEIKVPCRKETFIISAYMIFFMIAVTVASLNHDVRFMSPALVMLNLIAGIAFYNAMEIVRKKLNFSRKYFYPIAMFVLLFAQLATIFTSGLVGRELFGRILGNI